MVYNVKELIPHREPMLLVDEVVDFTKGDALKATKHFSQNDPVFAGHFPGFPVLPGVLSIEALAQASACFVNLNQGKTAEESLFFFMSLDSAKFRNPILPGTKVELDVRLIKQRRDVYKFQGTASANGEKVTEATFTAKWAPKQ
jgi:3-hydroxyacyl-[acyl-carrier-protein] dehydratase